MVFVAENQAPSEEPQRPRTKKKRTARNVLLGVVAFVLVVAVGAGVYAFNLASSFNSKSQKIEQAFPDDAARPEKVQEAPPTSCSSEATAAPLPWGQPKPAARRTSARTP